MTTLTHDELIDIVRTELRAAVPKVPEDADPTAHLRHDLGVDSLGALEFVARLEYRFQVVVSDDDWQRLTSIGQVADVIAEGLSAR